MYSNQPKIVGGGGGSKKKSVLQQPPKKKQGQGKTGQGKKRMPKPMPYYPSTGTNQKPGGMTDDMKTKIASRIQAWQDRNVSNRGSKLNP